MTDLAHAHPFAPILAPQPQLYYFAVDSTVLNGPMTALDFWDALNARPLPLMALAFRIRDGISSRFGVKRIGGFSYNRKTNPQVGDKLDFFLVEQMSDTHLVLTARDTHLDVMTTISVTNGRGYITSSVITHNWFGKLYMLPVGIAHKIIVRAMLRRLPR